MKILVLTSLLVLIAFAAISPPQIPVFNSSLLSSGSSTFSTNNSSSRLNSSSYGSASSYNFSSSAYTNKVFPKANLSQFIIDHSFSYNGDTKIIENAITNAQSNIASVNRSIDSYFVRMPTLEQLDQLILTADSFALMKTMQNLNIDQSLNCSQALYYLLEMLGRTRSALEKKRFIADQLNIIINDAKQYITKLQSDLSRVNSERKYLPLNSLNYNLKDYLNQLESLYKDFNNANTLLAPKQAQYADYNKQIQNWNAQNSRQRDKMLNDKLKVSQLQSKIKDLQSQLKNARDSKISYENSVKRSSDLISRNQRSINQTRQKIKTADLQLTAIQNNIDGLNRRIKNLEVSAERTRTNLATAESKDQALSKQAKNIIQAINNEKKKIVDDELVALNKIIDSLSKLEPTILSQIDRQYYYCFGDGVQTIQTYSTTIYLIKGEKFAQYIKSAYGDKLKVTASRYSPDFNFQVVDPFSQTWNSRYGYPFASTSLGSLNYSDVSLGGDFTCLNPSLAEVGQGIIKQVKNGVITIYDNQGLLVKLRIGACSRIESTKQLPSIGQNIAWRGISSDIGFNIYTMTCW